MGIRLSTYLVGGSIILLGVVLFQIKYTVADLESTHQQLKQAICSKNEEIHVLNAEWAYLNGTARLQELVRKYLPKLKPVKGNQVVPYAHVQNSGLGENNGNEYDREALDRLVDKAQKCPSLKTTQKNKGL